MTCRLGKHYTCGSCDAAGTCAEYIAPLFEKYEKVRGSGLYNMITEGSLAMSEMGLDPDSKRDRDAYFRIIKNYNRYAAGDFG